MMLHTFIPGRVWIAPAVFKNYKTLARFHYRPKHPTTIADVVAAWHQSPGRPARCVGAGVLSWPVACQAMRHQALSMTDWTYGQRLRFANANIRCISRVIVHPTFRSIGISGFIVRALIARCPTRYVETSAMMARATPLFDRAGMKRFEPDDPDKPVYFLFDKWIDRLPAIARCNPSGCHCLALRPSSARANQIIHTISVGQTFLSVTAFHAVRGRVEREADRNVCPTGGKICLTGAPILPPSLLSQMCSHQSHSL